MDTGLIIEVKKRKRRLKMHKDEIKMLLNEKLNDIIAKIIIDIHTQIKEVCFEFNLDEEQHLRLFGFVLEKMRRANDDANKKMGIKSLNLE